MNSDKTPFPSKVVWLTGLSGSGKSTIAQEFEGALQSQNIPAMNLMGMSYGLALIKA